MVGVTLGVAATGSKAVEALVKPLVRVLAPLPKVALYPAMVLILGFDHSSKIALVAADAVFPILLATWQGTAAVEPKLVWSARAAGCTPRRALFTVVLMAALPSVLTGCRIGLIISCIVVFLAEMITSTDGLGYSAGACGPQLPDRRHVRAADLDLDPGADAERGVQCTARLAAARISRGALMLADRIEGKWIDAFCEVFERCAVKRGDTAAILSETQSRQLNVQLAELALLRLGARPFHIVLPTPRNRHPVPVRSTGASEAIGGLAPVIGALGAAGFVVDCTIEGLMHAPETPAILKAGARIMVISNEHPEALERMAPDAGAGDARARAPRNCCADRSA